MNRQPAYRMGVGASSILMILVVLCLTVLGVLSFSSARASRTLAARRLAQVTRYYAAVAEAERTLCEIDEALLRAPGETDAYRAYVRALPERLSSAQVADDLTVSFSVEVSASQQLRVAVRPLGPGAFPRYETALHELVNVAPWEPDGAALPGPQQPLGQL